MHTACPTNTLTIPSIIPKKYRPEPACREPYQFARKPAYITGTHVPAGQTASCKKLTPKKPSPDLLPILLAAPSPLLLLPLYSARRKMLLLRAPTPFAYAKVDKVDAEEARHIRAQYLIQKVLEEKSPAVRSRPPALALARVKARIGVRLKKLRLAVRSVRVRACRTLQRHLRNLRRLIALGGQQGSGEPS